MITEASRTVVDLSAERVRRLADDSLRDLQANEQVVSPISAVTDLQSWRTPARQAGRRLGWRVRTGTTDALIWAVAEDGPHRGTDLQAVTRALLGIDAQKSTRRVGSLAARKVPDVCQPCNNEWMAELQENCCTVALTAGVHAKVVRELLGQSSITVTLDTYSHVTPGLHEAAVLAIGSLIFGTPEAHVRPTRSQTPRRASAAHLSQQLSLDDGPLITHTHPAASD